jgi:hypothetical protein
MPMKNKRFTSTGVGFSWVGSSETPPEAPKVRAINQGDRSDEKKNLTITESLKNYSLRGMKMRRVINWEQ